MEQTLGIIKPDAVRKNYIGEIIRLAETSGLVVTAMKMTQLSKKEAEGFYAVHQGKPFFDSLTSFMSEGPVTILVLSGPEAIATWRRIMGATDPAKAAEGTIRKRFAENIERNAVHGSDGPETAKFEIGYFFNALEIVR